MSEANEALVPIASAVTGETAYVRRSAIVLIVLMAGGEKNQTIFLQGGHHVLIKHNMALLEGLVDELPES